MITPAIAITNEMINLNLYFIILDILKPVKSPKPLAKKINIKNGAVALL